VQRGGAERVVETIADAFPEAEIFAIVYSADRGPASLAHRVRTSWLQRVPTASIRHRAFYPLFPAAIESFDLSDYDVIISSHHTVAKGVLRNGDQVQICYCHTPMRALWERSGDELKTLPAILRPIASTMFSAFRLWDYATAARVDQFVANSRVTQRRIASHYGRTSILLPPPIDVDHFTIGEGVPTGEAYYLVASRPVPYKRVDIAVAAALAANRRVIVAGGDHKGLPTDPRVTAVGSVDDGTLITLMRGATALLFPQKEDFGMTPLEMNACGRPTIAFAEGGATETVIDGKTGILVDQQTVSAFVKGIERCESISFDPQRLRDHAMQFSSSVFIDRLREIVIETWSLHRRTMA